MWQTSDIVAAIRRDAIKKRKEALPNMLQQADIENVARIVNNLRAVKIGPKDLADVHMVSEHLTILARDLMGAVVMYGPSMITQLLTTLVSNLTDTVEYYEACHESFKFQIEAAAGLDAMPLTEEAAPVVVPPELLKLLQAMGFEE